jgi:hypothetical protein
MEAKADPQGLVQMFTHLHAAFGKAAPLSGRGDLPASIAELQNLHQRITKIHPRLSHPMNQRYEHLLLHPQLLPHRFLHLGISPLVAHLLDALLDPLGRVALFLRQRFVLFDDLSDLLQVEANLLLRTGILQTIPRGLRMGQYLQCLRANSFSPPDLSFLPLSSQYLQS